jgi:hypothetical protein
MVLTLLRALRRCPTISLRRLDIFWGRQDSLADRVYAASYVAPALSLLATLYSAAPAKKGEMTAALRAIRRVTLLLRAVTLRAR